MIQIFTLLNDMDMTLNCGYIFDEKGLLSNIYFTRPRVVVMTMIFVIVSIQL